MAVGVCSAAFHVSLKYHTQMSMCRLFHINYHLAHTHHLFFSPVDDISMHFATTPVLHRVLTVNANRRDSIVTAIILGSMLVFLVTYHVITDELVLHSLFFVATVTIIGIRTMQLVNTRTLPRSASRRQIWGMVRFGAGP